MEQSVIETIEGSDFYQAIIRKKETDLVDKRKAAAAALASIDKDTAARAKGLAKTLQEAEKTCAEVEKAYQEALARVNQLRADRFGLGTRAEAAKNQHMAFLLETSNPKIDEAIAWFNDRHDAIRKQSADRDGGSGKLDPVSMTREIYTRTNHSARVEALQYCRRAIETLQGMKLEAEVDVEKLQRLAAGLPDPNNFFDEFKSRRPARDIADAPSWAKYPSDSQHDMEMSHLLKQAEKLKRKRA